MGSASFVWDAFSGDDLDATVVVRSRRDVGHLSTLRAKAIFLIETHTELRLLGPLKNGPAQSRDEDWERVGIYGLVDLQYRELESVLISEVKDLSKGVSDRQTQFIKGDRRRKEGTFEHSRLDNKGVSTKPGMDPVANLEHVQVVLVNPPDGGQNDRVDVLKRCRSCDS